MRRGARGLLLLLALGLPLSLPGRAHAQSEEEELQLLFGSRKVSSATKASHEEDADDTAAQVTVISGEEIRAFGWRTLAEVLMSVPECFTSGDRVYETAGVRGFARDGDFNTRVLILLDGHVLNEPWNNYTPVGTDLPIDFEQVERVEVIAGPVSAIYGSNAFFGAVNIVTKKPAKRTAGASIRSGSAGLDRGTAWYGGGGVLAWATGTMLSGEPIEYPAFSGTSQFSESHTDWDRNAGAGVSIYGSRAFFHATAYARRKGAIGGAFGSRFGDRRNWSQDAHGFAELALKLVQSDPVKLRLRAYVDGYAFDDNYRYDPDPVFVDHATSLWSGAETVLEWNAGPSALVLSLEDSYQRVTEVAREVQGAGTDAPDPASSTNQLPLDVRRFNLARAALQESVKLGQVGRVIGGLYVENEDLYGVQIAPRGGVVMHPWQGGTVKALYQRGFRSPSVYERFFTDADSIANNPDLKSESVDGFELSIGEKFSKGFEAELSGFDGEYHDLILQGDALPVGADLTRGVVFTQYRNGGSIREAGGTAQVDYRSRAFHVRADATGFYHHTDDGKRIAGSPDWLAHAVGVIPVANGHATLAGRITGIGPRGGTGGEVIGPLALADATIRVNRVWKDLSFLAGVTNLFDSTWLNPVEAEYPTATIPQPGRRFFLEARWDFAER